MSRNIIVLISPRSIPFPFVVTAIVLSLLSFSAESTRMRWARSLIRFSSSLFHFYSAR